MCKKVTLKTNELIQHVNGMLTVRGFNFFSKNQYKMTLNSHSLHFGNGAAGFGER